MGQKTHEDKDKEIKALKAQLLVKDDELAEKDTALTVAKDNGAALALEISEMDEPSGERGYDVNTGCHIFTPDEYKEWSANQGRVMGRKKGTKTNCTIEELRALINSHWTPSMVMEKHGMSAEDLKQLVWKLSKKELRGKPIKFDIKRDIFGREG